MLCPVTRPITTLDCVLLRGNNRTFVARSGPEISSRACLCVLQGPRHNTRYWFSIQRFIFLLIFCLTTCKKGSDPKNRWTKLSIASLSAISFPRTPACPRTQYIPTACHQNDRKHHVKNYKYQVKGMRCKHKIIKYYIWSMALYGAETWTLRAADQKYLESFEMWCWRRMEKIMKTKINQQHVSAPQSKPSSGSSKSLRVTKPLYWSVRMLLCICVRVVMW